MHFRVEHTFRGITLAAYEQLYFDEPFNVALCQEVKLHRELQSIERDEERVKRVVKVGPDREVPKPVAKVLKTDRIEYTEHLDYGFGTYRGTWKTIPSIMANKVRSEGAFSFSEADGGVRRVVEGDIEVKIMGVGSVVERFIVSDVEKSYEDAYRFTQRWIDQGKHEGLAQK